MLIIYFIITKMFKVALVLKGLLNVNKKINLINIFKCLFEFAMIDFFYMLHALSRVGRGNLVLRHSVPYFPPTYGGIAC